MSSEEISELFARAVELDPGGRARLLADLGAHDPTLVGQLERLLAAADTERGSVLDRSPWRLLHGGAPPVDGPVPDAIGPYRIVRELGRGGMGRVFLAEQRGPDFTRLVALKVVAPGGAGAVLERRFREERRILAGLEHPGIARFYDAGRTADGTWFLVLEYVQGEDLLRFVQERGLDVRSRVELFLQVLDAVDFAHRRLIVHRDLKPGNVLVGADGKAKLLDFGISKILDPDALDAGESPPTRTELRALTPAYASPEQLRGEPVTIAADVYSLGVMLYEILVGHRPAAHALAGTDPVPPSTAARTRPPGRPETGDGRFRGRELSGDLDAITMKALRAEPESRYRSAAAFADDLRRWLGGQPVEARRGSRRYRLGKFVARHRVAIAGAAAVVLALAGGLSLAMLQRSRALAAQARAEATVTDLHRLTQAMLFEIYEQVRHLPGSLAASGTIVRRATEVLDRLAATTGDDPRMLRDLATGYEQLGQMFGAHPAIARSLNRPRAAIDVLSRAASLRDRIAALPSATFEDRLAAAESLVLLGRAQLRTRDAKAAEASTREGIARLRRLEATAPDRAYLRYRLAVAHTRARPLMDQPAAEVARDPDFAAATRLWLELAAAPPSAALTGESFTQEATHAVMLLAVVGHRLEALRICDLALEALARHPPPGLSAQTLAGQRANLLVGRATTLGGLGRPAEAVTDFRELLRLRATEPVDPDDLLTQSIGRMSEGLMAAEAAVEAGDLDFAIAALAEAERWLAAGEQRYGAVAFAAARVDLGRARGDVLALQAERAGGAARARLQAAALAEYRSALAIVERMGNAATMHGVLPERIDELRRLVRELETSRP